MVSTPDLVLPPPTDIDEAENRLVYGVGDGGAECRLRTELAELDLPCELVKIARVGPIVVRSPGLAQ